MSKQDALDQLVNLKKLYHTGVGNLNNLLKRKEEQERELAEIAESQKVYQLKKIILHEASETARDDARKELERLATYALQAIIGKHVSLKIELDRKGNSPVAEFKVVTEYGDEEGQYIETDPAEEEGGGIADIVSFSTLITMLQLVGNPNNKAPLFLDEPSKFVSKGHSEDVAKFLSQISNIFDRQVFMVTHDENLANSGDKAYHFEIKAGTTEVTPVSHDEENDEQQGSLLNDNEVESEAV